MNIEDMNCYQISFFYLSKMQDIIKEILTKEEYDKEKIKQLCNVDMTEIFKNNKKHQILLKGFKAFFETIKKEINE